MMEDRNQSEPVQQHGRTVWDAGHSIATSRLVALSILLIALAFILWLFWDTFTSIPLYVVISIAASFLWYNPISRWVSRSSTYLEVWDPSNNTLTTWRIGKRALSEMTVDGEQNTVRSMFGSSRIFCDGIDLVNNHLSTSWVHECDPWTFHKERRTLVRLTQRVNEVYDDIIMAESMAQVEGRRHTIASMRSHYADLDNFFTGNVQIDDEEEAFDNAQVQPSN